MRHGTRTATADRSQQKLQSWLVIAETAIGLVLLVGSGLLIHTFVQVLRVNPGFDAHNVLAAEVGLPETKYTAAKMAQFYDQLLEKIAALPGVQVAAAATPLPMSGDAMAITFGIEGRQIDKSSEPAEAIAIVTSDFFSAMRIPLLRGRYFTRQDVAGKPAAVIITEKFAKKYFPNEDPIGKHIQPGLGDGLTKSSTMREIVGVVGDVKPEGLTQEFEPLYYLPYGQAVVGPLTLCIRTTGNPADVTGSVAAVLTSMDSSAPLFRVRTVESDVAKSAAQSRFQAILLTCFAVMALVLFSVGLYAVLSYTVAQRTVEIGVRMALGARREDMLRMFLKQGLKLTAIGSAIGLVLSFGLARVISSMLYGVKATDPSSFATVIVVMAAVSLLASFVPARRAMSIDPMTALKDE